MAAAANDPGERGGSRAARWLLAPPSCGVQLPARVPRAAPRRSSLRLPLSLPGSFASLTMATPTDSSEALVCYAGNLDGYQNLGFLLRSFARVRARVPAARLVLVTHAAPGALRRAVGPGVEIVRAASYDEVRARLGAAARHAVEDPRAWDGVLDRIETVYRNVLAARSAASTDPEASAPDGLGVAAE